MICWPNADEARKDFKAIMAAVISTVKMAAWVVPAFLVGTFLLGVVLFSMPGVDPQLLAGWTAPLRQLVSFLIS